MTRSTWPHRGFSAPFTLTGTSALVKPPPWHYAGWLLNIEFEYQAERGAPLVPPEAGRPVGRGCVHFADWQASTDGSELLDPVLAQYRETIVVLELERPDGSLCVYCPAIWVDQDVSLMRGLLQGWPKKMGTTYLTRSLPLQHPAAAPFQAGTRLGASLAVKERRLFEARAELLDYAARPLGFLSLPTLGAVGFADLRDPASLPGIDLVRPRVVDRTNAEWRAAAADLSLFPHPHEDVPALGVLRVSAASAGWLGMTITGAIDA